MSVPSYVVFSDSGCDLSPEIFSKWGVQYESLMFRFEDSEKEYANGEMPTADFYAKMRAGGIAKTAAVNTEQFCALFEKALCRGLDVLYLGFSSGISNTYNAGRLAAEQLREKYPDRKILTVDTLCASAGEALLVYLTMEKVNEGATIEEAAKYAEDTKLSLAHRFTVDDLVYLKRGGRVSATTAFVGNALGIKPVMHVDDQGKLIKLTTARGRRNSLLALAQAYRETALTPNKGHVFISHGDCKKDALELACMLHEQNGVEVELITDVGPVIGAHSGPGTLALFFLAAKR